MKRGFCTIGVDCPEPVYCDWQHGHCVQAASPPGVAGTAPGSAAAVTWNEKPMFWDSGVIPPGKPAPSWWVYWVTWALVMLTLAAGIGVALVS